MFTRFFYDADAGGAGGGTPDTGSTTPDNSDGDKRTFTQKELDALFAERARQAGQSATSGLLKEAGFENLDALKAALQKAKDAETAQMTELQKAQALAADEKTKREAAEKKADERQVQATEKLMRAAVLVEATKQNFVDPGDAWVLIDRSAIKTNDDDTFEGIGKAIEAVIKAKPYLVRKQQGAGLGTATTTKPKTTGGDAQKFPPLKLRL